LSSYFQKIIKIKMGCISIAGYSKGCDSSYGGIKKVAIYEKAAFDWTGMTVTNGTVSAVTLYDGFTGFTYDFLKDNSNWTEAIVGDGILTTINWTPIITLIFRRMSVELRNEIMELSKGDLVVLIKDYNDNTWFIGTDRGLQLVASAGGASGNNLTEMNGETLVIQGAETYKAYLVDLDTIGDPIASLMA
jgi:hypothetical protein